MMNILFLFRASKNVWLYINRNLAILVKTYKHVEKEILNNTSSVYDQGKDNVEIIETNVKVDIKVVLKNFKGEL